MDEPLKILLSVVVVVLVSVALIALVNDGSFISLITEKLTSAIAEISW